MRLNLNIIEICLKHPDRKVYKVGDLVYLYHGYGSELHAPAKKIPKELDRAIKNPEYFR